MPDDAIYGYCPECYKPGVSRERRPNGNDTCKEGHVYPSASALYRNGQKPAPAPVVPPAAPAAPAAPSVPRPPAALNLTPEQEKAIGLILAGHPVLVIGMRPTKEGVPCAPSDATGCDFLTCLMGDRETLMGAREHLDGVISRLYAKRGLI